MSEKTEGIELSENAKKYKTLARAIFANDEPACREIHSVLKSQGKELSEEEVQALGMRWFMNKERGVEVAKFLNELGFNFEQIIILDPQNERSGTAIPFRLIGDESDESVLLDLLKNKLISPDVGDGMGDNLITQALQMERFDLADKLLSLGVDIDHQNIAQQTSLHVMAAKLNYQAVEWLCENGANPGIEDIRGAISSQMVPETLEDWDTDCMYELLESYVESHDNGGGFFKTEEFEAMVAREKSLNDDESDMTLGEQASEAKALLKELGM